MSTYNQFCYCRRSHEPSSSEDDSRKFKFYCFYVIGVSAVIGLMKFFAMLSLELSYSRIHDIINTAYLIMVLLIALVNVLFLILAAVNLVKMAKTTNSSKHLRSETKNRFYLRFMKINSRINFNYSRFWMGVQLLGILLVSWITWSHEMYWAYSTHIEDYSFGCKIVIDAVKCFSTFLIFAIFVLNDDILKMLSDKYYVLIIK